VEKESIAARLDEETRRRFEEFYLCPGCRRIYWNGSHAARMDRFLKEVVAEIIKTPGAFMV
ncbi:MAG: hypothetical protein HY717_22275, partial [Planctomycetes bacterium]|nr:hypothetical protein [Planctomycetota bacterium]